MANYTIHLEEIRKRCCSFEVEADSPEAALAKASDQMIMGFDEDYEDIVKEWYVSSIQDETNDIRLTLQDAIQKQISPVQYTIEVMGLDSIQLPILNGHFENIELKRKCEGLPKHIKTQL